MKTTLAAITGISLVSAVYACSVPSVGALPTGGDEGAASNTPSPKPKTRAPANTTAPTTVQSITPTDAGAPASDASAIVTTTVGSSSSSSSSSSGSSTTSQPACQDDADPTACLDCCLAAHPGAVSFENDYGTCLALCDAGDQDCVNGCFADHILACQGSADCLANHACMSANNCLASNLCE